MVILYLRGRKVNTKVCPSGYKSEVLVKTQMVTLQDFKNKLTTEFHDSDDLFFRQITTDNVSCVLCYLDGGSDKQLLEQNVIAPILRAQSPLSSANLSSIVFYGEEIKPTPLDDCAGKIAEGDVILFFDGESDANLLSLRKFDKRAVVEPPTSNVLKGPREGFIEEIKTNVTLLRRRIKSPSLTVKNMQIGRFSSTPVALVYIDGIAEAKVIDEITRRLMAIDIDGVIDGAYLSSFIQGRRMSFFNQVGSSEKPDVVASKLLEGRVAIIVDGSPLVLTLPFVLFEDLQDGYDYYSNDWRSSMVRVFRILGALLTILLPGAYVALQSHHYHLMPLKFLITLLSATNGIPFPPAIEMFFVLLLFEILNQASIRMPRLMGISLSIVGAIVLGDTAVKAGLISSPAVLVTALSAIGIFCVPDQVGTLSILRFLFLCCSSVMGLFGIVILFLILIAYLASMDSYGSPYLAPYAPRITPDLKDGVLKSSTVNMTKRPYSIPSSNRNRMKEQRPDDSDFDNGSTPYHTKHVDEPENDVSTQNDVERSKQ